MNIDRTFWHRTKGSIEQAYSYAKDTTAINFAKKYGGKVLASMNVTLDNNLQNLLRGEVYSILYNSDPLEPTPSEGDFHILVKPVGLDWREYGNYLSISEANTEAKAIIGNYEAILVTFNA